MKGYLLVEAEGTRYGLRLQDVQQVMEADDVHPAPSVHAAVLGVISHGHRFMALVNLAALLQRAPRSAGGGSIVVVVQCGGNTLGLLVDDALTVERDQPGPLPEGWELPWASGVARYEGRLIPILDMDAVAERLAPAAAGEQA